MAVYQDWLIDNPRKFRSYALGNQFVNEDFSGQSLIIDSDAFKHNHQKL